MTMTPQDKDKLQKAFIAALREEKEYQDSFYLNEEEQKTRRIVFVHCEDETCGFLVEFKHPNSSFFFCEEHGTGINLDLETVPRAGVKCELHGKMERYDLMKDDNVCPRCEGSTLAILSVGRTEGEMVK